jgi:hypothetical protein
VQDGVGRHHQASGGQWRLLSGPTNTRLVERNHVADGHSARLEFIGSRPAPRLAARDDRRSKASSHVNRGQRGRSRNASVEV